jgi:hypothetical protein
LAALAQPGINQAGRHLVAQLAAPTWRLRGNAIVIVVPFEN